LSAVFFKGGSFGVAVDFRRCFDAAWNHRTGDHPLDVSAEVQLPKVGADLESIAAALAEAQSRDRTGGALLAADVKSLAVTHDESIPAHINVIGHSHGSTTIADAFASSGINANDAVLIGCPGTDLACSAGVQSQRRKALCGCGFHRCDQLDRRDRHRPRQ
jgi:Alpha/beta hydrolase/Hydrolase N-terminal helical domain